MKIKIIGRNQYKMTATLKGGPVVTYYYNGYTFQEALADFYHSVLQMQIQINR